MGLYESNFRFDGAPPDPQLVLTEARRRLGNVGGIEALEVEGQVLIARSMLDPFTHHVVCAILLQMGGRPVSIGGGQPVQIAVPPWAHHPISEMPWRQRMAIRYRWWQWLLGGASKS